MNNLSNSSFIISNRNFRRFFLVAIVLIAVDYSSFAQTQEIIVQNNYSLKFISIDPFLDSTVRNRMTEVFFTVYPKLTTEYNSNSLKEVTFFVDTAYNGVAEAGDGRVRFSHHWLRLHPGDIDVVTHEIMHIIQSYPDNAGPWWLTEGIADYVRHRFGIDNKGGGWSLPDYLPSQSYTNGYRVTARFLVWVEHRHPGFVKKLDSAMRAQTYELALWKNSTGKTIDELWKDYGLEPSGLDE